MKKLFLFTTLTMALGTCNNIQPMALSASKLTKQLLNTKNVSSVFKRYKRSHSRSRFNPKNYRLPSQKRSNQKTLNPKTKNNNNNPIFTNNTVVTNQSTVKNSATATPKSSMFSSFTQDMSNRAKDTFEGLKPIGKGIIYIYKTSLCQNVTKYYNEKIAKILKNKRLSEEFKYLQKEKLTGRAIAMRGALNILVLGSKIHLTYLGGSYLNTKQQLSYNTKMRLKKNFKEADTKIEQYGNPFS